MHFNSSNCVRKGQSYPVEYYLESVEEHSLSGGTIHMSEPESGNGNVNTVYSGCTLLIRPREILKSVARSLFTMNEHVIANVSLDLSFLLRIMFVKNILLQISLYAQTLKVNMRIFSTKFEG